MINRDERSSLLGRIISEIGRRGNEEKVRKIVAECKKWIKRYPEDKEVLDSYLSLLKKRIEDEGEIKEAIEYASSWLKAHPEDNKIRSTFITLVRDKGSKEDIEQALRDEGRWMREHDFHLLFGSYITLVLKVIKTEINVMIDTATVKEFGYNFIDYSEWRNPTEIENFANFLYRTGFHEEARQIYERLLEIRANIETMSMIRLSYGKMFLGRAMNSAKERIEMLKKAEEKIREALKLHKGHYIAHTFLTITLKEQGRENEAENELKEAERWARINKKEEFSPGEIPYKIGIFYLEFNRYEEAINWLKIAKEKEPEKFPNYWRLGQAEKKLALSLGENGLYKEAKRLFTEALHEIQIALKKAPKPLQSPAKEEIPANIEECKKHLVFLKDIKNREGETSLKV